MKEPNSPWSQSAFLKSPDGSLTAFINETGEISMGGPSSGTLMISNGQVIEDCSPSMVWSDDSNYLAVPQWTRERKQRLLVLQPRRRLIGRVQGKFRVLKLESFKEGRIRGVDSPAHDPHPIELTLVDVVWPS